MIPSMERDALAGVVVVLRDARGRLCDRRVADMCLEPFLVHAGIPFVTFDVSTEELDEDSLSSAALVLVGQERLLSGLPRGVLATLETAVNRGVGLVNVDCDLRGASGRVRSFLGLEPAKHPVCSDQLFFPSNRHYVTELHARNELLSIKRFVPLYPQASRSPDWRVLAEAILGKEQLIASRHLTPGTRLEPGHAPVLLARDSSGLGRMAHFNVSQRLWLEEFNGHVAGLDDVLYRLIVWTAKKPFAVKTLPPFVSLRIDDCVGAHDFRYVEIFNQYGFIPTVACFWDKLSESGWDRVKELSATGAARFPTHAFSYYDLLYYDFGVGEYPRDELSRRFEKEDAILARHGLEAPKTAHGHWNALGVNSLPFLKDRGRLFIENPCNIGELKCERTPVSIHPYGSDVMGYDFLEDDHDFFRFFQRAKAPGMTSVDFLEGDVLTWLGQSPRNDVSKAIERGAGQIKAGLTSQCFGQAVTHEQKLSVMTLDEIDDMGKGIAAELEPFNVIHKPLDDIAAHLKAHRRSRLEGVVVHDGKIEDVIISGEPEIAPTITVL